ncbi:MAG: hypothetical protein AB1489_01860 [Acidobacteriota bacterium]
MIIDVIDMEDPAVGGWAETALAGVNSEKVILYGMCNFSCTTGTPVR